MSEQEEFRCFIGNLSWSTSDRDLKEAFKKFGRLLDAKVVMDRSSGRSRGFGFVSFEDEKAMEDAIEAMNGLDLDGRPISVDKAQPNSGGGRDRDGDRDRDGGGRDRYRGGRDSDRDRGYGGGGGRGGSGGGGDCYRCGKPGHFARECPSGDGARGGGGGGGSRYSGRDDRYSGGGGGSRYGPDRNGDRFGGGRSRDSGSRGGGSGNDRYGRDRSGPYDRPSGGYR